jgi:hypothetical protein
MLLRLLVALRETRRLMGAIDGVGVVVQALGGEE